MPIQTLNLSQCKQYVRNIKDLEVSCYQQEQLLRELKRQPSITKNRIAELEHRLETEKAPEEPLSPNGEMIAALVFDIFFSFIGAIVGTLGGILVKIICSIFSSTISFFSTWIPYILWGAIIGYIIVFVLL